MRLPDNVDIQMLICLDALIAERSVTKAAERLGVSQPTVSRILGQLRELANDPLLVRTARGMEPTPRGIMLADGVRQHLAGLETLFADSVFDPATATGEITIAITEGRGAVLAPLLANRLREAAPQVRATFRHFDYQRIYEWLEVGVCDIGVGHLMDPPGGIYRLEVTRDRECCIVSRSHPHIREQLTLEQYAAARHIVFGHPHAAVASGEASIDQALAALGVKREVFVKLSSPLMVGEVVAETELVATVAERLAQYCALRWPVRILELPFEAPLLPISMVWHERTQRVPLCRWIRQEVRDLLGDAAEDARRRSAEPAVSLEPDSNAGSRGDSLR
jgi:DNA-binding transcriptional LysR family regulator